MSDDEGGHSSMEILLARQRKKKKELQAKFVTMKDEMEKKMASMEKEMEERHEREVAECKELNASSNAAPPAEETKEGVKEEGTFYKEKTTKDKNQKRQERKAEDRKKPAEAAAVDAKAAKTSMRTIEKTAVVVALNSSSVIVKPKEEPVDLAVQKEEPIDPTDQILNEDQHKSSDVVEPKKEPIDPTDAIPEEDEISLMQDISEYMGKEEEIDVKVETNYVPVEKSSNDGDANRNIDPSDMMGDQMNSVGDPIVGDHDSIPIEKESLENISSSGENEKDVAKTEIIGEAKVEEEDEEDKLIKDSSKTGVAEKRVRPQRRTSKTVKYAESLDESEEPPEKKQRIKPEKKIDNKRRSDSKDNGVKEQTPLKCPAVNCKKRPCSVQAWARHITRYHSSPRELGVALLCECGNESFSARHIVECVKQKFTVVRKSPTPKCVMCEAFPPTARAYASHVEREHRTSLIQMGIFLTCYCGVQVRTNSGDTQHATKCNGHEYTLHKLDEE